MSNPMEPLAAYLRLRIERSTSWLERAEKTPDEDPDAAFIFYWIAFNAAYGKDPSNDTHTPERYLFDDFFETILSMDANDEINNTIWKEFTGPVRILLDNEYVYWRYWENVFGNGHDDWQDWFNEDKRKGLEAVTNGDTRLVLNIIFDRLYVARNQIMHGGARWLSGRNREQVRDGVSILSAIVPLFIRLMEQNPQIAIDLGKPAYYMDNDDLAA